MANRNENSFATVSDKYGRTVNYLRLSVTDRCNLRCFYCHTCTNFSFIPHENILTYEECLELIQAGIVLGVNKVRLTGGEPFVRKDFVPFLGRVLSAFPDLDLRVTTNGTLLSGIVPHLREIGLRRLNISLDTLDREKYERITKRDLFHRVRQAIDDCLENSIQVKVNVVAVKGVNDDELPDFVRFALDNALDVRFIEFMPIGDDTGWSHGNYWSAVDILDRVQELTPIRPVLNRHRNSGPARMYELPEGLGRIGIISPLSNHFCAQCNRLRITPDGRLRTCLFSDQEYQLRPILRSPKLGQDSLQRVMLMASRKKPLGYTLLGQKGDQASLCHRVMSSIGG
jgi:cyclic pyranopterin phosphate synthase